MSAIECFTSSTAAKIDMDLIATENHNQQNQEELKARIKRLEEAGDAALNYSIGLDLQKENDALKQRIKRLEEENDAMRADLLLWKDWVEEERRKQ